MDFKKLISHIESIDGPIETPSAPKLAEPIRLDEGTELRVLAGVTALTESVIAEKAVKEKKVEAKKTSKAKKAEVEEGFDAGAKVGDKKKTQHGVMTKTATGVKHERKYGKDADGDEETKDKKIKKESKLDELSKTTLQSYITKRAEKHGDRQYGRAQGDEFVRRNDTPRDNADKWSEKEKKASRSAIRNIGKAASKLADPSYGTKESIDPLAEEANVKEGLEDKLAAAREKAAAKGKTVKNKEEKPKSNVRKVAGNAYGGSKQKDTGVDEAMSCKGKKRPVKESVERTMSFREMMQLVVESGGQQQIDPVDTELFAWASRVAKTKLGEGMKAEVYAGMVYERMGGVFQMYDVLSEDQK